MESAVLLHQQTLKAPEPSLNVIWHTEQKFTPICSLDKFSCELTQSVSQADAKLGKWLEGAKMLVIMTTMRHVEGSSEFCK